MLKKIAASLMAICMISGSLSMPVEITAEEELTIAEVMEMSSDEDYGEQIYAYNFCPIYQSSGSDSNDMGVSSSIAGLDDSIITVMIDPGHAGYYYNQSPVYRSYYESVMNWKISNYLKEELEALGVHADLTKTDIKDDPDLISRGNKSRGYDFFISMHSNANNYSSSMDQPLAICYQDVSWTDIDDTSREIGQLMTDLVADVMNTYNAGETYQRKSVEDRDGNGTLDDEWYGVLSGARYVGTPGILMEHSFHTNYRATVWLSNENNLRTMAKAEAALIYDYFTKKKAAESEGGGTTEQTPDVSDPIPHEDWIAGDVDGDRNVSLSDAMRTLSYYAENASGADAKFIKQTDDAAGEELVKQAADVITDTAIRIDDAAEIMKMYAEEAVSSDNAVIDELISTMTLEDKIYQMFMVTPETLLKSSKAVTSVDSDDLGSAEKLIDASPVGGVVYYGQNLSTWQQTHRMLKMTQRYSKNVNNNIGMFFAVDEEGGTVARVADKLGVYDCENMSYYGAAGDYAAVNNVGSTIGTALSDLGFTLNLAPVADIDLSEENALGERTFSSDSSVTANMAAEFVRGVEGKGVSTTLKHFPGLGAGTGDTHNGSVFINRTYEELQSAEFVAFKGGIDAGADFVMVGHQITAASGDNLPGCLSKTVITDWLKTELGFKGLVITDSQSMGAITDNYTSQQAAVMAVQAGADIVLMPKDLKSAVDGIAAAVADGTITEERINESVHKILSKKHEQGLV